MTTERLLELEDNNQNLVYLHREGSFLRCYERSAYFVWRYISPFKLRRRFVKKVNRDVISLGFPEAVKGKWLHGRPLNEIEKDLLVFEIGKEFDQQDYMAFEEEARVQTEAADRYTPRSTVIERQPVYQTAVSLATTCVRLGRNVPKTDLVPYGNSIKVLSGEVAYRVSVFYDASDREAAVTAIGKLLDRLNFSLKMLSDLHDISESALAETLQMSEGLLVQLNALKNPRKKSQPTESEENNPQNEND